MNISLCATWLWTETNSFNECTWWIFQQALSPGYVALTWESTASICFPSPDKTCTSDMFVAALSKNILFNLLLTSRYTKCTPHLRQSEHFYSAVRSFAAILLLLPCVPTSIKRKNFKQNVKRTDEANRMRNTNAWWSDRLQSGSVEEHNQCAYKIQSTRVIITTGSSCGLCGLLVRVPGYRSRGPGSIPGATRFSEK
jgi:hypothetical protein